MRRKLARKAERIDFKIERASHSRKKAPENHIDVRKREQSEYYENYREQYPFRRGTSLKNSFFVFHISPPQYVVSSILETRNFLTITAIIQDTAVSRSPIAEA